MLDVLPPETLSMETRDGVRLDADVYRPAEPGDYPVLLMRQPYGRRIATTVCFAHPAWYAAHGYIVVIQDVRGRGTSGGAFALFEQEAADGEDAVNWAAQLAGSTGTVGMYGFSYQGVTQLLAASALPPALKAITRRTRGMPVTRRHLRNSPRPRAALPWGGRTMRGLICCGVMRAMCPSMRRGSTLIFQTNIGTAFPRLRRRRR